MFTRKKLFNFVRFCVDKDSIHRCNLSLYDWLHNSQFKDKPDYSFPHAGKMSLLEEKFRIKESEVDFVKGILSSYQEELVIKYFKEELVCYSNVTEVEYFILTLHEFLVKYFYRPEFLAYNKEIYEWSNGVKTLTDYGQVLYKILLITEHYNFNFAKGEIGMDTVAGMRYHALKKYVESGVMDD